MKKTVISWVWLGSMVWQIFAVSVQAQAKLSTIYDLPIAAKQIYHIQFDAVIEKIGVIPPAIIVKVIDQHLWLESEPGISKSQVLQIITQTGHWVLNLTPALISDQTTHLTATGTNAMVDANKTHKLFAKTAQPAPELYYSRVIASVRQLMVQKTLPDWVPYTEYVQPVWQNLLQCSVVAPLQCTDLVQIKLLQVWRHSVLLDQTDLFFWLLELQINPLRLADSSVSGANASQTLPVALDMGAMRGDWLASMYHLSFLDNQQPSMKVFMISASAKPLP